MNVLIDRLPEMVEIDGECYPLRTDYRTALRIMEAFEDPVLTEQEKQMIMLELLYEQIPDNLEKACEMAVKFLNGGDDGGNRTKQQQDDCERRYSFSKDGKYIFTAILQTHGIDLERVDNLHWWKFLYLFMDLREDCFFSRIIYYRTQRAKGKLTKEEAAYCRSISDILDLPEEHDREAEEAANVFMQLLRGGEKNG